MPTSTPMAPEGNPNPPKKIRVVRVASNKNYIIGQIYNLSGEVTALRIILRKRDSRKIELEKNLKDLEEKELTGQEGYENKKKIKEVQKSIGENDEEMEKSENIIENKEEMCLSYQEELNDAIEYEFPKKE